MWKIVRALFGVAHALMRVAVELAEHDRRSRGMAEAIDDLEAAQSDRDAADNDLSTALAAELDRVKTDVQHLEDEIGAGAGNTDPARLVRVTQTIRAGIDRVKGLTDQLNATDPVPDFPAAAPTPAANDGGVAATDAPVQTGAVDTSSAPSTGNAVPDAAQQ